jgi:hypothetical protein
VGWGGSFPFSRNRSFHLVPRQGNLNTRADPSFGQRQQEVLQEHPHTSGVRKTEILMEEDKSCYWGVKKLPVAKDISHATRLVISANSHRSVDLRTKLEPILLELLGQGHCPLGRFLLCLRKQSGRQAITSEAGNERHVPWLDVGVRWCALSEGECLVQKFSWHGFGEEITGRVTLLDGVIEFIFIGSF